MVELIPDMAGGTLGFRVSGRLTREDYLEVLVPTLREAVQSGGRLRVLYAIGPKLQMEPGALWEDIKLGLGMGIQHRDAWERTAVVSDLDWIWRALELFSWMVPGEMRLFRESEIDQARRWVAD
jgi:SpoIIAA-like